MITSEQEVWLAHLDDINKIEVYPYDIKVEKKFEKVKKSLVVILGKEIEIFHMGASGLGISGQKEIDVYVPISIKVFNLLLTPLEKVFGKPRSHYPLERVCFVTEVDGTKVEIFVINDKGKDWMDGLKFFNYLKENKDVLEAYRILKEESNRLSIRSYYRKKVEFINDIKLKIK